MKKAIKKASKAQPIHLPNGIFVGTLKNGILTKNAKKSVHMYRAIGNGAWGIDYDVLHKVLPNNGSIEIHESEEGKVWLTTVAIFKERGVVLHFKEHTKDHYTQVFLPVECWRVAG